MAVSNPQVLLFLSLSYFRAAVSCHTVVTKPPHKKQSRLFSYNQTGMEKSASTEFTLASKLHTLSYSTTLSCSWHPTKSVDMSASCLYISYWACGIMYRWTYCIMLHWHLCSASQFISTVYTLVTIPSENMFPMIIRSRTEAANMMMILTTFDGWWWNIISLYMRAADCRVQKDSCVGGNLKMHSSSKKTKSGWPHCSFYFLFCLFISGCYRRQ